MNIHKSLEIEYFLSMLKTMGQRTKILEETYAFQIGTSHSSSLASEHM